MAPPVDPDEFPSHVGEGTRMILDALQGWRHEEREAQALKHAANEERMGAIERELIAVSAAVKLGYPNGDADAHRRYHELLIEREEEKQVIRREVITHLIKTSTWLALGGLVALLLKQLKDFFIR